jgi:cold shock CspA family protein
MATGTVKWFNTDKGQASITQNDRGKDVSVHVDRSHGPTRQPRGRHVRAAGS